MKKIEIGLERGTIIIKDDDNSNISSYTKELSKILEATKICILETTEKNIILKPSEISHIIVSEDIDNDIKFLKKSSGKIIEKEKAIQKDVLDNNDIIKD